MTAAQAAGVPTPSFDPREMALRGRIGAYRLHATHDPKETTKAAREAFMARFEREVDPETERLSPKSAPGVLKPPVKPTSPNSPTNPLRPDGAAPQRPRMGPPMSNPTNTTTPGSTTPGLSLLVLPDLLTALQPEWSGLPPPLPLFLREAQHGLTEVLEVTE